MNRLSGVDDGCGEQKEAGLTECWEGEWSGRDPMKASKSGLEWLLACVDRVGWSANPRQEGSEAEPGPAIRHPSTCRNPATPLVPLPRGRLLGGLLTMCESRCRTVRAPVCTTATAIATAVATARATVCQHRGK